MPWTNEKTRPGGQKPDPTEANSQAISVLSKIEVAADCANEGRTCGKSDAQLTRARSATVPSDARRLEREAEALRVVRAMRVAVHPGPGRGTRYFNLLVPEEPKEAPYTALRGPDPEAKGNVYFLYCAERLKIGFSLDVPRRVGEIAGACPFPVRLLLTITGDESDEAGYHAMFAKDRINREWFRLSLDLRDFLVRQFETGGMENMQNAECDFAELMYSELEFLREYLPPSLFNGEKHDDSGEGLGSYRRVDRDWHGQQHRP